MFCIKTLNAALNDITSHNIILCVSSLLSLIFLSFNESILQVMARTVWRPKGHNQSHNNYHDSLMVPNSRRAQNQRGSSSCFDCGPHLPVQCQCGGWQIGNCLKICISIYNFLPKQLDFSHIFCFQSFNATWKMGLWWFLQIPTEIWDLKEEMKSSSWQARTCYTKSYPDNLNM